MARLRWLLRLLRGHDASLMLQMHHAARAGHPSQFIHLEDRS